MLGRATKHKAAAVLSTGVVASDGTSSVAAERALRRSSLAHSATPSGTGPASASAASPAPVVSNELTCALFVGASDGTVTVLSVTLPGSGPDAPPASIGLVAKGLSGHTTSLMTLG
jgi:hypothetical protein